MDFPSTKCKNMLQSCYCIGILIRISIKRGNVTPTIGREDLKSNDLFQRIVIERSQKGSLRSHQYIPLEDKSTFNSDQVHGTSTPYCSCTLHISLCSSLQYHLTWALSSNLGSRGQGKVNRRKGSHWTLPLHYGLLGL